LFNEQGRVALTSSAGYFRPFEFPGDFVRKAFFYFSFGGAFAPFLGYFRSFFHSVWWLIPKENPLGLEMFIAR
jgi:hypothetical protein